MIFLSLHYGVPAQAQRSGLRGEKEGQRNGADARRQVGVAEGSLSRRADAEGGLKIRAQLRPDLQGFGGGQPPTSEPRYMYIPRHCLPLLLFCPNSLDTTVLFNFVRTYSKTEQSSYFDLISMLPSFVFAIASIFPSTIFPVEV